MNKQYLYDFFDSLKNQTYQNFDVIVVNDECKDFEKIKILYRNIEYNRTSIFKQTSKKQRTWNKLLYKPQKMIYIGDDDILNKSLEKIGIKFINIRDLDLKYFSKISEVL